MGVRGLTTYINSNKDVFLKQYLLHDSNLVVDGHSLCAQLYRLINSFSAFGGDYDKFASFTRSFFKNLRKCNITAYLIFDGSYEKKKLKTAYSRLRNKISGASKLDPVTQDSLQIFPLLLRDVFKEVLTDMDIPFTICEFEADDEIAAMARHLKCPVLSYDSDFFIYNVLYIPFNTLDFKPAPYEKDGKRIYAMECKIYKVEYMTKKFGGIQEELLPLLATLLGNDFVEKKVFNKFFSQLKLPKGKSMKNEQQRCIKGLLKWLQNETLDSAVAKIIGRLKKNKKERVFYIIKKSINGYSKTHCRSLNYFNINYKEESTVDIKMPDINVDLDNVDVENEESDENEEPDENDNDESDNDEVCNEEEEESNDDSILGLPLWFANGIRNKIIPHTYINLYTHHLHFCSPQADDYTDEDPFLCVIPILKYAYDILSDSEESLTYVSRENNCSYKRIEIGSEYSIPKLLHTSYCDLAPDQLKLVFNHFVNEKLGVLDESLCDLPQNFQLYMISMLWWVSKCKVPLANVHSLFITYIMLEVIDEKTGNFRGHNFFNNKYSKKIEELKRRPPMDVELELPLNKNKVQYEDCLIAASVLLRHFDIDKSILKKPRSYDSKRVHSFAQFQCCLQQFNCLNTLCGLPYESPKYSKSYSGTFAYNISLKLENELDPHECLEQYLKGATTVLKFYNVLCSVYKKMADKLNVKTVAFIQKTKKRRRRKCNINDDIDFIVKGFESEVII